MATASVTAPSFKPNMQLWDTNVVRRAARGACDPVKLKGSYNVGISPIIFLELCTKLDESFEEKKAAARIAVDHGTHFLPDPTTYLRFVWGIIDEIAAATVAKEFERLLRRLADPALTLAEAKNEFAAEQLERARAYEAWAKDLEASRQNIVTDPEFIKRRTSSENKTSLGKDALPRVQKLMGTSFVTWTIIEGTLDRITQDGEKSQEFLRSTSAMDLKMAWMSVQVFTDIYRAYFEDLLITGASIDPNDKGDSELLFYLYGLKLLVPDAEPVLTTFEAKWKGFAEAAGWDDRVWKLK